MASTRETAVAGLHAVLDAALPWATVLRNAVLPERMPEIGLVILRDGDPGEPEATLSPLTWHYEHRAEIEVIALDDAGFDAVCSAIGAAVTGNRTLGGTVRWAECEAVAPSDIYAEGAAPPKAGIIPVVLYYSTTDPLN